MKGCLRRHASHFCKIGGDEIVVAEIGMLTIDAVDLVHLAGAEALVRIEAPDALHQALPPQHFVAAGDAAVKIVGDVEEGAVAIGDAGIEREQVGRYAVLVRAPPCSARTA